MDDMNYSGTDVEYETEEKKNAIIGIYNKSLTKKGEYNHF